MKFLLHRFTALLLAVLLFCSAGGVLAFAAQTALPDPGCTLGTDPSDMLAAGGRRVTAGDRLFYVEENDGCVYDADHRKTPVLQGPVSKLNYADGVLYFAREREEGSFDLCAFDLARGEETILLASFAGRLGQVYLVDGQYLDFSSDNAVWQLELETGDYRLILFAEDLWSFVPTGAGLVYATGSLFDYNLYADGKLLAEHAVDYTVYPDRADGLIVYTVDGEGYQADLREALAGIAEPAAFGGFDTDYTTLSAGDNLTPEEEGLAEEAESLRLQAELADILARPENRTGNAAPTAAPPDPAAADPDDPQLPADLIPEEPAEEPTQPAEEPTQPAEEPVEPTEEPTVPEEAPVEPAEPSAPAEADADSPRPAPAKDEPVDVEPEKPGKDRPEVPETSDEAVTPGATAGSGEARMDEPAIEVVDPPVSPAAVLPQGALRPALSANQQNIVRRARQMLNVRWTPRKGVGGWGYYDSSYNLRLYYKAGETYTGLPYGQGLDYVPWTTSPTGFVKAVKDANSKMYTTRCTYSRGSQYYGTDCSGFVSWAWQTNRRKTCTTLKAWEGTIKVENSYTKLMIGDALIKSGHTVLVTDVTYGPDGAINSVEVSQANPTAADNGCCYSTSFTGQSALERMNKSYFVNGGYSIYRRSADTPVTYAHDCAVPLEGDVCPVCGVGEEPEDPLDAQYAPMGVDVSYAQGTVDWRALAPNIDFAIIRAGFTGYERPNIKMDTQYKANIAGCKANHIPFGLYFYAGATTVEMAIKEANAVLGFIDKNNLPSLPIFYDVEETRNILSLDNNQLLSVITAFCSTIENSGFRAGVYASTSVMNNRMTDAAYDKWARWAAQWNSSSLTSKKGAHVWQFDSHGSLPGIAAGVKVDQNYWLGEVGDVSGSSKAAKVAPTCAETGSLTCTRVSNGESVLLPIRPLGHTYQNGVCSRCGANESVFARFRDVGPNKWYSDAVAWAVENGITAGTGENTFSPKEHCTRAQIVTFLWRLAGSPEPTVTENPYVDVKPSKYYYKAVLWAAEKGITSGTGANTFSPGRECTRAQAVTFLWRYAGSPEPEQLDNPFRDVKRSSSYFKAILWARDSGITAGTSEDMFSPETVCNRATIVKFLFEMNNSLSQNG